LRYEGTAQRDLFRELRRRFLDRHRVDAAWMLDGGSGPGRFTEAIGGPRSAAVALDLSREMLGQGERLSADPRAVDRVRGDLRRPPFAHAVFGEVTLLGNSVGFAGDDGAALLSATEALVAPGGILIVETAPGAGERSRYVARLPTGAAARLFESPPTLVTGRILREGFDPEPRRHREREFRRWSATELADRYGRLGWSVLESMAVAPATGADPTVVEAIAAHPRAWSRLLDTEELLGRRPEQQRRAAALLVAVRRPGAGGRT
jgi:hypothetical protein